MIVPPGYGGKTPEELKKERSAKKAKQSFAKNRSKRKKKK